MIQSDNTLFYSTQGIGTKGTVVFLHGFLGSGEIWERIIPNFEEEYCILNIDLPGHGKSGFLQETLTMSFCAEKVIEVLKKEKILNAHFVGHSMGGYVGLEILNSHPNLVSSLTLFNSTAMDDTAQKKKDRLLAVKVFDRSPEVFINAAIENLFYKPNLKRFKDDVKALQQIALQTPTEGAQACLKGMRERNNYVDLIRSTTTPIQIIAGKYDNTVLYHTILKQTKDSNVMLTTLDSGHMGFVESFEESRDAMFKFINSYS